MIATNADLYELNIGPVFAKLLKRRTKPLAHALRQDLPPVLRDKDNLILGFVDGMGSFAQFHGMKLREDTGQCSP
jgi:hypothetical protein